MGYCDQRIGSVIGCVIPSACVCVQDAQNNPPGRRVVKSDLRSSIVLVAVYWRLPEATGDGPKGKWYQASVKSRNSRNGTLQIAYLEDGSQDDVDIEKEHVVWMENPVLNIEEPGAPKRSYVRRPTPKCPCGK